MRIDQALVRVDVILGDKLPRLALECGRLGEEDPVFQLDRPQLSAFGDYRQSLGRVGNHFCRFGQIVELIESFEDLGRDARRIKIGALLRVETGNVVGRNAQHLSGISRRVGRHW
jgi:hypothetical protein